MAADLTHNPKTPAYDALEMRLKNPVPYKLDLKVKDLEYFFYHCSHVWRLTDEKLEPEQRNTMSVQHLWYDIMTIIGNWT